MSGVLIKDTARNLMVLMVQSSDHLTGLPSLTLTVTASKNGAAFASISPSVTDRGDGWYSIALTASHTDTVGDLALHITGASADPLDLRFSVEFPTAELIKSNLLLSGNTWEDLFNNIDGTIPTAAQNADAVWDEARAGHTAAGSFGEGVVVNSLANGAITALSIAADAITAAKVASDVGTEIATAVWDAVLESTYTAKQLMRGIVAASLGKVVFGASNAFKRMDGTTTAWTVAVDATGRTTSTPGTL